MPNAIPAVTPPSSSPLDDILARQRAAGPGGKLGKDEFLQLLTAQLKYQDPMNPLDGHQMAADLAQFSGLEQLLNVNEQLEAQTANAQVILSAINNSVALGTIGKTVVAASDQIILADDGSGTIDGTVTVDVVEEGPGTLEILDAAGNVVGSRPLGFLSARNELSLNVGTAAAGLAAGTYTVRITTTDAKGAAAPQRTYYTGIVDGLSYSPQGAVLTSNGVEVSIGMIRRITA